MHVDDPPPESREDGPADDPHEPRQHDQIGRVTRDGIRQSSVPRIAIRMVFRQDELGDHAALACILERGSPGTITDHGNDARMATAGIDRLRKGTEVRTTTAGEDHEREGQRERFLVHARALADRRLACEARCSSLQRRGRGARFGARLPRERAGENVNGFRQMIHVSRTAELGCGTTEKRWARSSTMSSRSPELLGSCSIAEFGYHRYAVAWHGEAAARG